MLGNHSTRQSSVLSQSDLESTAATAMQGRDYIAKGSLQALHQAVAHAAVGPLASRPYVEHAAS